MKIVTFGGGFKPPTAGHFGVVKAAASQVPDADKILVFVGKDSRQGITQEVSYAIWKIYEKYLPGNVEIINASKPPIGEIYSLATNNPNDQIIWILGAREGRGDDIDDIKNRTSYYNKNKEKYPNLDIQVITTPNTDMSGTNARKAVLAGNQEAFFKYLPTEVKEKEEVFNILDQAMNNTPEKKMIDAIGEVFDSFETQKENSSGTAIKPIGAVKSEDRNKLVNTYYQLQNVLGTNYYNIDFNKDHIRISLKDERQSSNFDYTPYMASILEYMIDQGMNVAPLPEVKIKRDMVEAVDFFGKTAYYDPNSKEVVLYVQNRHPKDVMRSFTHEMIHHIQNNEGRLTNIRTQNTNEDSYLQEIEKEAYLLGNITFRNWEDSVKNPAPKQTMAEGVYDSLVTRLSRQVITKWVSDFKKDPKRLFSALDINVEEEDAKGRPMEFDLIAKIDFKKTKERTYSVDGGANEGDDESEGFVALSFQVDPRSLPQQWETIAMDVRDVLRHELEHLTQGGWNVRNDKAMADDSEIRDMINKYKLLAPANYFLLDKEVDAMLQGMYYKAKKSRKPFKDVVDHYLSMQPIDAEEKESILNKWRKRLPVLGIKQEL